MRSRVVIDLRYLRGVRLWARLPVASCPWSRRAAVGAGGATGVGTGGITGADAGTVVHPLAQLRCVEHATLFGCHCGLGADRAPAGGSAGAILALAWSVWRRRRRETIQDPYARND